MDIIAAVVLTLLLAPLFAVIALWIRLRDGPPVLVRLTRVGRNGDAFRMFKFRTMVPDLPDGSAGGSRITVHGDSRITQSGAFLRHYRLDEIPQLLNVLRREMAILGPRPEAPQFVTADANWDEVLKVRPGIAGLTQVLVSELEATALRGSDGENVYCAEVLPIKLALDRLYLQKASLRLDALILRSLTDSVLLNVQPDRLHKWLAEAAPAQLDRLMQLGGVPSGKGPDSGEAEDDIRYQ
jgi:lipopolysaccharide/colanic/teichoic acid biosynthesis glycosyltransferase